MVAFWLYHGGDRSATKKDFRSSKWTEEKPPKLWISCKRNQQEQIIQKRNDQ